MQSTTMLALPPLKIGTAEWCLPLCDSAAMELTQALVERNDDRRTEQLAAALALDPVLAVWAGLQASRSFQSGEQCWTFEGIAPMAQWLAVDLLHRLDWRDATPNRCFSKEQQSRFAALVAESVGAAREATRGFPSDFASLQPAYLHHLTSYWRQWLTTTSAEQVLPDGFSLANTFPTATEAGASLSEEARLTAEEAAGRWMTAVPGVQSLLPPLAAQLRQVRELEASFAARLQTAKLDAMKELAYGAGHELNNPLANIASRAQTLLAEERDPERKRRLAAINTQAFRAHEMLADLMLFARPPKPRFEQVNLVQLADEVVKELAGEAARQETAFYRLDRDAPCVIEADPTQLRVALRALCTNSLEALRQGGTVTVEIRGQVEADGSQESGIRRHEAGTVTSSVQIRVADDGPGIAPDIREKIFDPFFSGREAGRGLGFGLSKCWRIVTLHDGRIDVESQLPRGSAFIITLPAIQRCRS